MSFPTVSFGVMSSVVEQPPIVSGLVGMYSPSSFSISNSRWYDLSGNKNDAVLSGTGHSITTTTASTFGSTKSFNTVTGNSSSKILWPSAILPSTYTLFYVARYNTSNSSTAATQLNYKDGSTTTRGLTGGVGGTTTTTSVNGEWVFTYQSFETGDSIWAGEYSLLDDSGITANNSYIVTVEARSDDPFLSNGTSTFSHVWDSSSYQFQAGDGPVMSTDRRFSTIKFTAGSTFALGNRWIRGMNKSGMSYGSNVKSYWRNWYAYRVAQTETHIIFSGEDRSWYSGFWAGNAGSAYHGNVLTISNNHSNNWVLGTDQNGGGSTQLLRTNKVQRYSGTPSNPGTTYARLAVNSTEPIGSNYQIADVLVYNRTLSASEYQEVENYLSFKYGVA